MIYSRQEGFAAVAPTSVQNADGEVTAVTVPEVDDLSIECARTRWVSKPSL